MSSKIPVFSYRRDVKKFVTPKKDNEDKNLQKSMNENNINSSFSSSLSGDLNKKTPVQKYKNVRSKVNSHWSPEEKQRTGLSTYFSRKVTKQNGPTSPEAQRQAMSIINRKCNSSLNIDPIATAIAQMKVATSPSSSSTNSSYISLPEWPVTHD
ncbi:hypothetical protein PVAND_001157 [Polypedilum vanderplanki]|uniref:Uncharacterized protein n=1 Tax=Polypedilum vanderplanki TaxID=319348 RepID=A0A9J6BMH8_POLVA|nr:hypothetical protein PVAND_001157 [Polypedilum vanderplanki]